MPVKEHQPSKKMVEIWAKTNAHMTTKEIKKDNSDTVAEIKTLTREEKYYRLMGDKMSVFRATGKRRGIVNRQRFVEVLQAILERRKSGVRND